VCQEEASLAWGKGHGQVEGEASHREKDRDSFSALGARPDKHTATALSG
jgi:hypothetical protein